MPDVEVFFLIFSEISSVGEKHKCFCKATNVFVNAFISSSFCCILANNNDSAKIVCNNSY